MNKQVINSVSILLLLIFNGCGSDSDNKDDISPTSVSTATFEPIPSTASTPIPSTASTPTPTLSTLSKIKKTGQSISYDTFDDGYYGLGITPSYSKEGDMIIDNITGLKWLRLDKSFTWDNAMYQCDSLSAKGYFDWRLPTINEFLGLVDIGNESQAFDPIFSNIIGSVFWSSTIVKEQQSLRWGMHILNVGGYRYEKTYKHAVMCVRR